MSRDLSVPSAASRAASRDLSRAPCDPSRAANQLRVERPVISYKASIASRDVFQATHWLHETATCRMQFLSLIPSTLWPLESVICFLIIVIVKAIVIC